MGPWQPLGQGAGSPGAHVGPGGDGFLAALGHMRGGGVGGGQRCPVWVLWLRVLALSGLHVARAFSHLVAGLARMLTTVRGSSGSEGPHVGGGGIGGSGTLLWSGSAVAGGGRQGCLPTLTCHWFWGLPAGGSRLPRDKAAKAGG